MSLNLVLILFAFTLSSDNITISKYILYHCNIQTEKMTPTVARLVCLAPGSGYTNLVKRIAFSKLAAH